MSQVIGADGRPGEHRQETRRDFLLQAGDAVPIHGRNDKDAPADAAGWLDRLGDPYDRTGADLSGRVGIEWGVYGVPETYVVSLDGRIMHKHVGPVTQRDLDETILPLVRELQR